MEETKFAVEVLNGCKSYGPKKVLQKLNMKVHEGAIYGLLGPSGCGKTTLISALVGRTKLDYGQIRMSTSNKSDIGYMPQDITLYLEMSIEEHLSYYGRLYFMKEADIKTRTEELAIFLQLPSSKTIINTMSGGEQRRVSLCIALFHNPKLLILDEPTVGVDVVLAHSIWEMLIHMSQHEGKTIIITTHYIEEARSSNTIGLMRNGILLAEMSPNKLIEEQNCDSLEQAFLNLCQLQGDNVEVFEEIQDNKYNLKEDSMKPIDHLKATKIVTFQRIYAHILKNIYWMKRNIPILLFMFALPIIQCCLASVTIGENPRGLSLAVVNDEMTAGLDDCLTEKWLGPVNCSGEGIPFSCFIMQRLLNRSVKIETFKTLSAARKSVEKNYNWGMLHFNSEYTSALRERVQHVLAMRNDTILELSQINIWLDTTNQVISNSLKGDIISSVMSFIYETCDMCEWSTATSVSPFKYGEPVFGTSSPNIRQYMTPANAVLFEFYFPVLFTVSVLIDEKTSGLLDRSIIAGLSLVEIVIGHIFLQYAVLIVQTFLEWIILFHFFDNPIVGNVGSCLILLLMIGTCGMFYGFTIVCNCDSFTSAAVTTFGGYFPIFLLSGALWPVEGMNYILKNIATYLPVTRTVEAFRSLSVRGYPMSHVSVYSSFIAIIVWSAICIIVCICLLKFKG